MGLCCRLVLLAFTVLSAIVLYGVYDIIRPLPAPKIDVNEYWGPGSAKDYKSDSKPVQQTIAYNDKTIEDLRRKLNETVELHPALEGTGFQYGMNPKKLVEFIDYWKDDYLPRWREREQYFNTLPHYLINVQGLNIHYIHQHPTGNVKGKTVVPLLLLHGWPGSVREFYEIIPKLAATNPELDVVFEIIAPSLAGFGWSDAARRPGFGCVSMATVMRNLMLKLGYTKFYVQGGDWGSIIGSHITTLYPENVVAYHSNMCAINSPLSMIKKTIAAYTKSFFVEKDIEDFMFPVSKKLEGILIEMGYFHIQATKPDTVGAVLTNNPIGLAAYILEKFSTWTNAEYRDREDGGFNSNDYSKDALLDNIMVYYLTNSIGTSVRLYAESFTKKELGYDMDRVPTTVPTGCARFRHDLGHHLDWELRDKYINLVHSKFHKRGGHFIAFEKPDVLYTDFIEFIKKLQK